MEYDLIVRSGMVIDGTGLPRRRVDVAVKDGRIARIGRPKTSNGGAGMSPAPARLSSAPIKPSPLPRVP
jgi:N-acyl-D-aspartate/D-glutamate deacylase